MVSVALHQIECKGFIHKGSGILDVEVFLKRTDVLFQAKREFENLECIGFGSGFKMLYQKGDTKTNIHELGKSLGKKFEDLCKRTRQRSLPDF